MGTTHNQIHADAFLYQGVDVYTEQDFVLPKQCKRIKFYFNITKTNILEQIQ